MKRIQIATLSVLALFVGGVACASTGEGSGTSRDMNVLLPEEMAEAAASNLYEAVDQLRPRWLQVRSVQSLTGGPGGVAVFQGTSYLGGSDELRRMGLDGVARLRYLDGPLANAQLRTPSGVPMPGAIVVEYDR